MDDPIRLNIKLDDRRRRDSGCGGLCSALLIVALVLMCVVLAGAAT